MKRMLMNAMNEDELRVALTDGKRVYDLSVETTSSSQTKNSIFKGRIIRIEPSLEAAFVEYSADGDVRQGFLPFREIAASCYRQDHRKNKTGESPEESENTEANAPPQTTRSKINEVIKEGQEILVQVEKEERGTKGAALTTYISLAGAFVVLMPYNPNVGGISRSIEGSDRSELRQVLEKINLPPNMGLITRTASTGKSIEEIQLDVDQLVHLWNAINTAATTYPAPKLIYQESNLVVRVLRDYLRNDTEQIIIDAPKAYEEAKAYLEATRPDLVSRLRLFDEQSQIFTYYQVESQIEAAFQRVISLPSGGSIVIDRTEALTAIDINSAKSTSGGNIEETAVSTNTEAAYAIADQLRLRDLGGLIVIDFIDMLDKNNRARVENALRDALRADRARIEVGELSKFGLLEMSRERRRPSLDDTTQIQCPRCAGQGSIRSIHSLSHTLLRLIEEQGLKENTQDVRLQVPVDVSTYLLNEKRHDIMELEKRLKITAYIIPNPNLQSPQHIIERTRSTTTSATTPSEKQAPKPTSYNMVTKQKKDANKPDFKTKRETSVVNNFSIDKNAVAKKPAADSPGLVKKILSLFGAAKEPPKPVQKNVFSNPGQRRNQSYNKNRKTRYNNRNKSGPKPAGTGPASSPTTAPSGEQK